MSYFAFDRDKHGNILVSDQQVLEALELLVQNLQQLNEMIEEGFETYMKLEDTENGTNTR